MKAKLPKELNETLDRLGRLADVVLAYHPKAKSKPAVQRKRRATILKNAPQYAKLLRSLERKKKKGGG